jgi:hypothetical protein
MRQSAAEVWLPFTGPDRQWRGGEVVGRRWWCTIKTSTSYSRGHDGMAPFYEGRRRGGDYTSYARLHGAWEVDQPHRAATARSASAGGGIIPKEEDDGHAGLGWAILAS